MSEEIKARFPEVESKRLGFYLIFAVFCVVNMLALLPYRKRWFWTYCLVVIGVGMCSFFMPFCIPLLIFWLKQDTKDYFSYVADTPVA